MPNLNSVAVGHSRGGSGPGSTVDRKRATGSRARTDVYVSRGIDSADRNGIRRCHRGERHIALRIESEGIGIRIEDDVVVTRDGCDVLSRDVPKTIREIEATMAA